MTVRWYQCPIEIDKVYRLDHCDGSGRENQDDGKKVLKSFTGCQKLLLMVRDIYGSQW